MSKENEIRIPQESINWSEVSINIFGFIKIEAKKIKPWVVLGIIAIVIGSLLLFTGWGIHEYHDEIIDFVNEYKGI